MAGGCSEDGRKANGVDGQNVEQNISPEVSMVEFLALHTCNLVDDVRTGVNPFTGETVQFHIDVGLSDTEIAALKELLEEYHAKGPDPDYYYSVSFGDESNVSVGTGPMDGTSPCIGIGISIVGPVTVDVLSFIRQIAVRTNMTVGSATDPDTLAVLGESKTDEMVKRWPDAAILKTEDEFVNWVRNVLEIDVVK